MRKTLYPYNNNNILYIHLPFLINQDLLLLISKLFHLKINPPHGNPFIQVEPDSMRAEDDEQDEKNNPNQN